MMTMCLGRIYGHQIVQIIKAMRADFFLKNARKSVFKLGETAMYFSFVASILLLFILIRFIWTKKR